jgi:ABC-type transporter Mla MlaB component
MNKTFSIISTCSGDMDHFAFHGNIDALAETHLKELPGKIQRPLVTLDFGNTGRINSMGIALLLRCLKTIKEEKKASVRLVKPNQMNTLLFKMTGISLLAELVTDRTC